MIYKMAEDVEPAVSHFTHLAIHQWQHHNFVPNVKCQIEQSNEGTTYTFRYNLNNFDFQLDLMRIIQIILENRLLMKTKILSQERNTSFSNTLRVFRSLFIEFSFDLMYCFCVYIIFKLNLNDSLRVECIFFL